MADELTAAGLHIDSLEDRIAAVKAEIRALIAPNLDLSTETPLGQIVEIWCERTQAALELARSLYASLDPDGASGDALAARSLWTGTVKRGATAGLVLLTVNLDGGTNLPAGSVAAVAGEPANRWATTEAVPAPAGPAADYTVVAEAEETGAIQALAGTITVIATPVAGWNTVTNAADAVPGAGEESDPDLRLRREDELEGGGSATVNSIRAGLRRLEGMISAIVYENDLDVAADGIPPHAVEAVIWDGPIPAVANADIAETVWTRKAAGIRPWGSTITDHEDSAGISHEVRFTRVAPIRCRVRVEVLVDSDYAGNASVRDAVEARAAAFLTPGVDLYRSRVTDWVMDVAGVVNVIVVTLARWPDAEAAVDLPMDVREIATIDAADVTVMS